MPQQEVSKVYADMLEYRQQMYENVLYSYHRYFIELNKLLKLPLMWRRHAMGLNEWIANRNFYNEYRDN